MEDDTNDRRDGMDILAACVEANVRAAAFTTERLLEAKDAELASMCEAFAGMYDALDAVPDSIRTVHMDRLLRRYAWARDAADRALVPVSS